MDGTKGKRSPKNTTELPPQGLTFYSALVVASTADRHEFFFFNFAVFYTARKLLWEELYNHFDQELSQNDRVDGLQSFVNDRDKSENWKSFLRVN